MKPENEIRDDVQRLLDANDRLIDALYEATPTNAIVIIEKTMEMARRLKEGIKKELIDTDDVEQDLFMIGKSIFDSNHEGHLLVSVQDATVRRLFEIIGTPKEVSAQFRNPHEMRVAVITGGITALARHFDDRNIGKA